MDFSVHLYLGMKRIVKVKHISLKQLRALLDAGYLVVVTS